MEEKIKNIGGSQGKLEHDLKQLNDKFLKKYNALFFKSFTVLAPRNDKIVSSMLILVGSALALTISNLASLIEVIGRNGLSEFIHYLLLSIGFGFGAKICNYFIDGQVGKIETKEINKLVSGYLNEHHEIKCSAGFCTHEDLQPLSVGETHDRISYPLPFLKTAKKFDDVKIAKSMFRIVVYQSICLTLQAVYIFYAFYIIASSLKV